MPRSPLPFPLALYSAPQTPMRASPGTRSIPLRAPATIPACAHVLALVHAGSVDGPMSPTLSASEHLPGNGGAVRVGVKRIPVVLQNRTRSNPKISSPLYCCITLPRTRHSTICVVFLDTVSSATFLDDPAPLDMYSCIPIFLDDPAPARLARSIASHRRSRSSLLTIQLHLFPLLRCTSLLPSASAYGHCTDCTKLLLFGVFGYEPSCI
ncbi:hypothetical protein MSAN_00441100 [Mycena sanguinolenta]|uniref:Uncharacterized protein n=1 Tax=Mycena sanguinolenta TaxID=230812 RepID=A0A8H6ZDX6_9AGAR|nr:hypothetical protein MSAN_00441100 [Mycena sanguinolenta]